MQQHELFPAPGSHKAAKRVGRGNGSGHGTYSGRGCKGNKARAGFNVRPGFEGGQLPIIKRLPEKRGFVNKFRVEYQAVNLSALSFFEAGSTVDADALIAAGIIKDASKPIKILGTGSIDKAIKVIADKCSASAKAAIEAAGGSIEVKEDAAV